MTNSPILPPIALHLRLKYLRQFCGLTQVEVANYLKIDQSTLSKVEHNTLTPDINFLEGIRKLYSVSADAIFDGVIPYFKCAKKMNRNHQLLNLKFLKNPTTTISIIYPFIATYRCLLDNKDFLNILKQLEITPYMLADPTIPINIRPLWELIDHGVQRHLFTNNKDIYKKLTRNIPENTKSELFINATGVNPKNFFTNFIKTSGLHETVPHFIIKESKKNSILVSINHYNKKTEDDFAFNNAQRVYSCFAGAILHDLAQSFSGKQVKVSTEYVHEAIDDFNQISKVYHTIKW
ncbi:MAG: helix-turn-helix transcriptional regulator [Bacteriovoracaceae bacterium]|nr:helix-turn-helix transcriptional regulator [Bacteriovoracaceae bacterium]